MTERAAFLDDRGVVRVSGEDAAGFLQGLLTNDVERLGPREARYAALLSPQGKILFDFLVVRAPADAGAAFCSIAGRAGGRSRQAARRSTSCAPRSSIADESADHGDHRLLARRAGKRAGRGRSTPIRAPARSAIARSCRAPRRSRSAKRASANTRRCASASASPRAASISPMARPFPTTPTWISSTASTSKRDATSARRSFRA